MPVSCQGGVQAQGGIRPREGLVQAQGGVRPREGGVQASPEFLYCICLCYWPEANTVQLMAVVKKDQFTFDSLSPLFKKDQP